MDRAKPTSSAEITPEWLDDRLAEANYCDTAEVGGAELRAIMDLAARSKGYYAAGLDRLRDVCNEKEVRLSGTDIRLLLMLARQAKRWNLPRRPDAVQASAK